MKTLCAGRKMRPMCAPLCRISPICQTTLPEIEEDISIRNVNPYREENVSFSLEWDYMVCSESANL